MNRTDDGTIAPENPRAAAARIQDETRGRWVVWWGPANSRYWAMPRGGDRLIEAPTAARLVDAMTGSTP